jgi:hypothetical protein
MRNYLVMIVTLLLIFMLPGATTCSFLYAETPTFQKLMDPNVFPDSQLGMEIEKVSVNSDNLTIETTGSKMEMNYTVGSVTFSQKIGCQRKILMATIQPAYSKPTVTHSGPGFVFAKFTKPSFDLRVNGDSLFMFHAKEPLKICLKPLYIPAFEGNYKSNHLLLDEYGGFGVYCSIKDLPDNYNRFSDTVATYQLPADAVLWIGICPPKKYDWQKSLNDNVLWHWSTVTSYPDDETMKSWVKYGNTVLFQGEIMLWKDWNLGFKPRLGMEQWNRVKNTLHSQNIKYMVYTSPSYFLRGTGKEEYAVNSFENFKGWPPPESRPFNGENIDTFLSEITKVMKELKPDGLYFDGTYCENLAAQYKLARSARGIIGVNGLLEWHSTLAFGKIKVKDLCYLPQVDAYADYILRGEHLKTDFNDLNYLRYFVSGYNTSNSIGVFCTRDHSFITPEFCEILFNNNIRLHLATGKENLRIKKYSGWDDQPEPLERYCRLYLSKLTPDLKDKVERLCEKRQIDFIQQTWPKLVAEQKTVKQKHLSAPSNKTP